MDWVTWVILGFLICQTGVLWWNYRDQQFLNRKAHEDVIGLAEDLVLMQFSIRMIASGRLQDPVTEEKVDE